MNNARIHKENVGTNEELVQPMVSNVRYRFFIGVKL